MNSDIYTIAEAFVGVGDGHTLYAQEWGDPKGMPIIFLHGGPGSGCNESHRQLFNPEKHRVIFFDQRGCGRSLPYGSLKHNTTDKLIEDIEKIALHFKMPRFVITGGSWGSCLALSYGIAHPKSVIAMVLRGIFTGTQTEIDFIDNGEFKTFFPEVWERLLSQTPKEHRHDPVHYHCQRVLGNDEIAAQESAYIYENLDRSLLNLDDRFKPAVWSEYDPTSIRIAIYYMVHHCFLRDDYIIKQAPKLTMPIWLVQGRYDMICPARTAYELHNRLPDSELIWTTSGHKSERESWNVLRNILLQMSRK